MQRAAEFSQAGKRVRRRATLVYAAVLLCLARLGLAVLPLPWMLLWGGSPIAGARQNKRGAAEVLWAIERVHPRLFGLATCLSQALVARWWMRRYGYHPLLKIGVRRDGEIGFGAHAWLELDGEVILGANDPGFGQYKELVRGGL